MAIVPASGTLDTSWAEFNTVGYTASALATLSACIDAVGVKLNRGAITSTSAPKDSEIADWITRGKQQLAQTKGYTWKRRLVTMTTTSGTFRYSLPVDFGGGYAKLRNQSNDTAIRIIDDHAFDMYYPDVSSVDNGEPLTATVKNQELWFYPAPGGAYVIELDYQRTGDDADYRDLSWIPAAERWSLVDYALAESYETLQQFEQAQYYWTKWSQDVKLSRRSDGKRKWSKYTTARSIFQA